MSDKPQEKKQPEWMNGPGGAKPIRIRQLRFRTGITVDLPKSAAAKYVVDESITRDEKGRMPTEERINIPRYKIHYVPWLGEFAVTFFPAGGTEQFGAPTWVPREWAQAEPAE